MSAELVPIRPPDATATRANDWIALVKPAADLAVQIAATEFVPAELRNRPEAIAACILYGAELGVGPMVALAKVSVVKGRPAPSAELGRALALAAGHEVWIEDASNTRVVMGGKRRGSTHVFKVSWSMDDAKRAGIAGNPSYARYPRQMLVARASAELVRQMCPDVLGGITVFAEEAADLDDTAPAASVSTLVPAEPSEPRKRRRRTLTAAPPTDPTDGGEEHDRAAGDELRDHGDDRDRDSADRPSEAQIKVIMAGFKRAGITERDDRLQITSAFVGHPVTSANDLTRSDASVVIDALQRHEVGALIFTRDTEGTWHVEPVIDPELDT